jgi:hypothetical protein
MTLSVLAFAYIMGVWPGNLLMWAGLLSCYLLGPMGGTAGVSALNTFMDECTYFSI